MRANEGASAIILDSVSSSQVLAPFVSCVRQGEITMDPIQSEEEWENFVRVHNSLFSRLNVAFSFYRRRGNLNNIPPELLKAIREKGEELSRALSGGIQ